MSVNRSEMANEFFVSLISYSMIIITDYMILTEEKYQGAWISINIIGFTLVFNMVVVLYNMV